LPFVYKTGAAPFYSILVKETPAGRPISRISATEMLRHITLWEYKSIKLVE